MVWIIMIFGITIYLSLLFVKTGCKKNRWEKIVEEMINPMVLP